ncbi:hypothetical protein [Umezawaea sp. Da 62-37]|uniref:hypothetical protein n=1 Tax=Umezawaea sp. Da 62-37 TaxID=3075927 RepID=UPI0028F6C1E1|nr:hypothetical protein [Umezawaea sp. Da 62-37]WNV82231.1 hypothetical protein RM788_28935 [Umezawaea sp. Da 62-37]
MNSDGPQTSNPDEHAVFLTHDVLEIARGEFVRAVTRLATRPSPEATALRTVLTEQASEVRALHALSVGYGWSDAIHRVTTAEALDRAREHGHVGTDLATGCPVLTGTGQRALSRWRDFVSPLRDLPEYAPMWLFVHGLDG